MIATDYAVQNSTNPVNTLDVMKNRRLVDFIDDIDFNTKKSPVSHTDNNSNDDGNRKIDNNLEDSRLEKADLDRQNQRTPRVAPNPWYYNFYIIYKKY